nr:hypothetical protein [Bacteroides caecimuris]
MCDEKTIVVLRGVAVPCGGNARHQRFITSRFRSGAEKEPVDYGAAAV